MQLTEAIKSRKSTKKFSGKSVDWKKVIQAMDLARFAPMAGAQYSLKYIFVEKKETIEQIKDACQQDFVSDAGAAIVVVSDRNKVKKMYDYNDKGFAAQQAGAAIQNILLGLTEKKIDNCWIGFFDDNLMKEATEVPKDKTIEAVIALGNAPSKTIKHKKNEILLDNLVFFHKWDNKSLETQTRVSPNVDRSNYK